MEAIGGWLDSQDKTMLRLFWWTGWVAVLIAILW
jgi:hypothetical protein